MDLEVYKRRLKNTPSQSEALLYNSIRQVKSVFRNSPNYREVVVGDKTYHIRVDRLKDRELNVLLEPETIVNLGTIMNVDNENWLVTEVLPNKIYPKAVMSLCNSVAFWKLDDGVWESSMCVSKSDKSLSLEQTSKEHVTLAKGNVVLYLPYNEKTSKLSETQKIVVNNKSFRIVGIDDISLLHNNIGNLIVYIERVSKSLEDEVTAVPLPDGDNIVEEDNSSGWGEW